MTTDAARKAVFNTPELLENIILFLPYKDILTKVQRLSRQWKNVVSSSPVIRSKLWTSIQNMRAVQPTRFTDEQTYPVSSHWGQQETPIYPHTLTSNTILLDRSVESWRFSWRGDSAFSWLDENRSDSNASQSAAIDFFYHKTGDTQNNSANGTRSTWKDMYLTNPPITTAIIHLISYEGPRRLGDLDLIRFAVRDHRGLTLDLVHDTIMAGLPTGVRKMMASNYMLVASLYVAFDKST